MKTVLGALIVVAGTVMSQGADAASYGGARFLGPAYQPKSHNGQVGGVTYFGAPPRTLPTRNGQVGNVTFLGGARPHALPSRNGQVGNVTFIGARPMGTVPVRTIPVPGIVPVRRGP